MNLILRPFLFSVFLTTCCFVRIEAQCTAGCPGGALSTLPTGGTQTLAAGDVYCISGSIDNSGTAYVINGTLIVESGTLATGNITVNKTGVLIVKGHARLNVNGNFTGQYVVPSSTIDNIIVCSTGILFISGSFQQYSTNIEVNDTGILEVVGAWLANAATDISVKIGMGSLVEVCGSLSMNKDGFLTETSSSSSYLVVRGGVSQGASPGWLSSSQSASLVKFTSDGSATGISHPAANTCIGCGNYDLAPAGTNGTCGSAVSSYIPIVLPEIISRFYEAVTAKTLSVTAELAESYPRSAVTLESSADGRQFRATACTATVNGRQYRFRLPLQKAAAYYRLRVDHDNAVVYSTILKPAIPPAGSKPRVFPNPAGSFIYLQLPVHHAYTHITLFTNTGQAVRQEEIAASAGLVRMDLPPGLPPGSYFIKLTGDSRAPFMRPFVKKGP